MNFKNAYNSIYQSNLIINKNKSIFWLMALKLEHYLIGKTLRVGAFRKIKCKLTFH